MDKGLLNDATSSDDSPVSGYMLKEIASKYSLLFAICLYIYIYIYMCFIIFVYICYCICIYILLYLFVEYTLL